MYRDKSEVGFAICKKKKVRLNVPDHASASHVPNISVVIVIVNYKYETTFNFEIRLKDRYLSPHFGKRE